MSPDDGVIGLDQRFTNIEVLLREISEKLNRKVDIESFAGLQRRVELLESGETPLGKYMIRQFDQVQAILNDVVQHGSPGARDTATELAEVTRRVDSLERQAIESRATILINQERMLKNLRVAGILVGILASSGWVIQVLLHVH